MTTATATIDIDALPMHMICTGCYEAPRAGDGPGAGGGLCEACADDDWDGTPTEGDCAGCGQLADLYGTMCARCDRADADA